MKYKVAKVIVTGVEARAVDKRTITRGLTGAVVEFEYRDPMWDGLKKLAVFEGYSEPVGFLADTNLVVLPWEVTTQIGAWVKVGVYGEDATGATVIPTIWAELGSVQSAPDGKFNPPGTPTPSIWGQILAMIGDLDDLETEARENLVAAINEAMKTGEGGTGGYYTPVVSSPEAGVMRVSFAPSEEGMEPIAAVDIPIPAGRDGKDGADGKDGQDGQDGAPGEPGVYTLSEGESIEDVPESATVVVDPYGEAEEGGTDISLGVSGASVGQVVRVAAVDENGVPTAWEPVEMASGGGGEKYFLLNTFVAEEAVSSVEFTESDDGTPYDLIATLVIVNFPGNDATYGKVVYEDNNVSLAINNLVHPTRRGVWKTWRQFGAVETERWWSGASATGFDDRAEYSTAVPLNAVIGGYENVTGIKLYTPNGAEVKFSVEIWGIPA